LAWIDRDRRRKNRKLPELGSDQKQTQKSGGVLWEPHHRLRRRKREKKKIPGYANSGEDTLFRDTGIRET